MSSIKKEEERNEKIIRGLLKLPPNRKCINCNSPGPQYVCTNFWSFICVTCSGIHREFTHRVKSISMAKFTIHEVEALQIGGNQRAREFFFNDYNKDLNALPDNSNIDKIRELIKSVYVDKKYASGKSFDKPPRDIHSQKNHDDLRRASSYHAFSQSPPYEGQYEDGQYGKQAKLSRKPGSDRGQYGGKISSFIFSPGRQDDQPLEDKFASNTSGSRNSDFSNSSRGDLFASDSSTRLEAGGYGSPSSEQVRGILTQRSMPEAIGKFIEKIGKVDTDMVPQTKRTTSSSSFGSFESNTASLTSANSDNLMDAFLESEHSSKELDLMLADPSNQLIDTQQNASSPSSIDLFGISRILTTSSEQTNPFSEDAGWATFDLPGQPASGKIDEDQIPGTIPSENQPKEDSSLSMFNSSAWPVPFMVDAQHEVAQAANGFSQSWNAFEDCKTQSSSGITDEKSKEHILSHMPSISGDMYSLTNSEELGTADRCLVFGIDDFAALSVPSDSLAGSLFSYPVLQFEEGNADGNAQENNLTNPFLLPIESHQEVAHVHLEMLSLKEALPNPSADVLGDVSDTWFVENPFKSYGPSVPHGELSSTFGQVPNSHFWDIPPKDVVVAAIGSNPFA